MQDKTLSQKVQYLRDWARQVLRMKWINRNKKNIYTLEQEIKAYQDQINKNEEALQVYQYEKIDTLDKNHPIYKKTKKANEEYFAELSKSLKSENGHLESSIENCTKDIQEKEENINKWETGENKVSHEYINELVEKKMYELPVDQVLGFDETPAETDDK